MCRRDGRWMARLELERTAGKRRRKFIYGHSRDEVAKKLAAALVALQQGTPIPVGRRTVSQFLAEWLETIKPPMIRPRTHQNYEALCRLHIEPALGRVALVKLEPQAIQNMLNKALRAGSAPQTVKHIRTVLRRALNLALKYRLISYNAATLVELPNRERGEIKPLTREETRTLIEVAKGSHLEAFLIVAVRLGLRRGEILGLKWEDLNLDARTLNVVRAVQRLPKQPLAALPLKTKGSRRNLIIPDEVVNALRAHRVRQLEIRLAAEMWDDGDWVFCNSLGKPMEPRLVDARFKKLLKRAELPDSVRLHDLRHTCATLLLESGADLFEVSRLLGHSSISITADVYGHVTPSMKRGLADRMDAL